MEPRPTKLQSKPWVWELPLYETGAAGMPALMQGLGPALHISWHRKPWARALSCLSQAWASDQACHQTFALALFWAAGRCEAGMPDPVAAAGRPAACQGRKPPC